MQLLRFVVCQCSHPFTLLHPWLPSLASLHPSLSLYRLIAASAASPSLPFAFSEIHMVREALARALARELLDERAPHTQTAVQRWASTFMTTGRDPGKWHVSISLRGILRADKRLIVGDAEDISGEHIAAAIQQSEQLQVTSAEYDRRKGVIYVKLSHEAVVGACMECAAASALGLTMPVTETFQARVLKWVDAEDSGSRITAYRSALSANALASTSAKLAELSGLPAGMGCFEILRGRRDVPLDAMPLRRQGSRIFGQMFASMHMPKLFTALQGLGYLRVDPAPGALALTMTLPGPKRDTTVVMADGAGKVSALAADACVLYMLMRERLAQMAAERQQQGVAETWYHYVSNSRECLHWQNVIRIAELACKFSTAAPGTARRGSSASPRQIKNTLCYVGDAAVGDAVARDNASQTFKLLDSLGLFGNPTAGIDDVSSGDADSVSHDVLQTALHYGMLSTAGKNKHTVESLEGPTDGSFLQYNHARLSRITEQHPESQVPRYWASVDPEFIRGSDAHMVAHLVAQLPEVLYVALSTHRPEIVATFFNRLAHAVSKSIMQLRVKNMDPQVADSRARFLAAVRSVLAVGIRILGCNPVVSM
ncbi:hypothetical protein GQ54DRAFT_302058 [Martensiomyces pterosporus]|nr:hypothetical protein GQ54DRAFT_302058 [Martensiomyces pterosporus]